MQRLTEILNDDYEIIQCDYKNQRSKITLKHKKCENIFQKTASKLLMGQIVCTKCKTNRKKTLEDIQEEISNISKELEVVDVVNSENIQLKHIPCGTIVKRSLYEVRKHKGIFCPTCKSSFGSREIQNFLSENKIEFIKEYIFKGCKLKRYLPFDFYLPQHNICIEFDGEHHERALHHWGGKSQFELVKKRDEIKNQFCRENNIELIRIKYSQRFKIKAILSKKLF